MEIKAFKGFRFNSDVVGDVGACVSPPYDVIDGDGQDELYNRNDHNIVRIIKGKDTNGDGNACDKYSKAGEFLNSWIQSGALKQDEKEAIYAYVQDFDIDGVSFERSGFVALGKVEDFGGRVKAHEKTLDGPKADRLNLMRATQAQFGQIFMLYNDAEKVADAIIAEKVGCGEADVDITDDDGVRHRLFAVDDAEQIAKIQEMMAKNESVIADGHHRYETALNFSKESDNDNAKYRMMCYVNMHNEGLVILPTHRLVGNLESFDMAGLIEKLEGEFDVAQFDGRDEMFAELKKKFEDNKIAFGIYAQGSKFYCVCLKSVSSMDKFSELSQASKELDVSVLHKIILDEKLGIGDKQLASQSNLKYIKDIGDAVDKSIARVDSGEKQVVFFMNPTRIEQVREVAGAGEKMPQKSTFFHPKIFTGLVINKL